MTVSEASSVSFNNSVIQFTGNIAEGDSKASGGGAVFVQNTENSGSSDVPSLYFNNSDISFTNNKSTNGYGGAIFSGETRDIIINPVP